jgi:hypothetical protein
MGWKRREHLRKDRKRLLRYKKQIADIRYRSDMQISGGQQMSRGQRTGRKGRYRSEEEAMQEMSLN